MVIKQSQIILTKIF